jgi:hypothetical protein
MTALERISRLVNRNGPVNDPAVPRPQLTLEEFFEGNDDPGSIVVNLGLDGDFVSELYELLKTIRDRQTVADVRIEISMHDDPEGWPYSDTIWVVGRCSVADLRLWIGERFSPDEVYEGRPGHPAEDIKVPVGMTLFRLWYD